MIDVTLPIPPSVNGIWRAIAVNGNKRKVVKSQKYNEWLHFAGNELSQQRQTAVSGWYVIEIYLPASMAGDAGNREKALSDLFVRFCLIDDDHYAWRTVIERSHDVAPKRCRVLIYPNNVTRAVGGDVAQSPRAKMSSVRVGAEAA